MGFTGEELESREMKGLQLGQASTKVHHPDDPLPKPGLFTTSWSLLLLALLFIQESDSLIAAGLAQPIMGLCCLTACREGGRHFSLDKNSWV